MVATVSVLGLIVTLVFGREDTEQHVIERLSWLALTCARGYERIRDSALSVARAKQAD